MSQKSRSTSGGHRRTIQSVFLKLPLFEDDLYLRMQALNLDVVDQILQDMESDLLALYIEMERTPGPQAVLVSALSQLWVFGVYELIRTWRTRAERIIGFAESLIGVSHNEQERLLDEQKRR